MNKAEILLEDIYCAQIFRTKPTTCSKWTKLFGKQRDSVAPVKAASAVEKGCTSAPMVSLTRFWELVRIEHWELGQTDVTKS